MGVMMGQQMVNAMGGQMGMNNNVPYSSNGVAPKFCPECGTKTEGAKFCPNCGKKLV